MAEDSAQQIFLCPTCGAQNVVGQQVCQVCGQRFQYNCPYCGFVVDPTLINCPSCHGVLEWPTPQRVKAFPKKRRTKAQQEQEITEGEEGAKPGRKKGDSWLMGCLGIVIVAFLFMGGYFVYDTFLQGTPPATQLPPLSTDNQTSLEPMRPLEAEFMHADVSDLVSDAVVLIQNSGAFLSPMHKGGSQCRQATQSN